jgi:hypothetical protein
LARERGEARTLESLPQKPAWSEKATPTPNALRQG